MISKFLMKYLGADGLEHFFISAILTSILSLIIPNYIAIIVVAIIGISKEIYDKLSKKGCAEWKDLVCDALGILIGAI